MRKKVKKKKRRNETAVIAAAAAATAGRAKGMARIQIRIPMHTMQIKDWQRGVNMNHLEIGRIETMIDEIGKCHHIEIGIGIEIDSTDGPDHRLDQNDVKMNDVIVHRVTIQTETEADRSNGQENHDNHLSIDSKIIKGVIQVEIDQIVTMTVIAVDQGQCHQDESQIVDIHDHGPEAVHLQDEQMIPNQPINPHQ